MRGRQVTNKVYKTRNARPDRKPLHCLGSMPGLEDSCPFLGDVHEEKVKFYVQVATFTVLCSNPVEVLETPPPQRF